MSHLTDVTRQLVVLPRWAVSAARRVIAAAVVTFAALIVLPTAAHAQVKADAVGAAAPATPPVPSPTEALDSGTLAWTAAVVVFAVLVVLALIVTPRIAAGRRHATS